MKDFTVLESGNSKFSFDSSLVSASNSLQFFKESKEKHRLCSVTTLNICFFIQPRRIVQISLLKIDHDHVMFEIFTDLKIIDRCKLKLTNTIEPG